MQSLDQQNYGSLADGICFIWPGEHIRGATVFTKMFGNAKFKIWQNYCKVSREMQTCFQYGWADGIMLAEHIQDAEMQPSKTKNLYSDILIRHYFDPKKSISVTTFEGEGANS